MRHHAAHVLHRRREVEARRRRSLAAFHGAGGAERAEVVLAVSQVVLLGLLVLLHLVHLQLEHGAGGGVVRLVVLRRGGGGWRETSKHRRTGKMRTKVISNIQIKESKSVCV